MIYKVTVSYKLNGEWKKAVKKFEDEKEMRLRIKNYLKNDKYTHKCYWIEEITNKEIFYEKNKNYTKVTGNNYDNIELTAEMPKDCTIEDAKKKAVDLDKTAREMLDAIYKNENTEL